MKFATPFLLYSSLSAPTAGEVEPHVDGYRRLLKAVRDDKYDWQAASTREVIGYQTLPISEEA